MEERKLNFNAPLLSVRRYSSPVPSRDREYGKIIDDSRLHRRYTIPFYNTELNLEQVTEPVNVPFLWEKIPGKAKDSGTEAQQPEETSVTPRLLPPRRVSDKVKYPFGREFEDKPQLKSCSLNENVSGLDCSKEENDEKENSDLENDDDSYSDALDTLSPTDSFSVNCSGSGLSGSDGEAVKRSGTFSTDQQTRDFMMGRFLPAAKAMTLQPAQYASRKQPAATEQPRQVVKVVSEDRRPLVNKSIVIPHYDQDVDEEESEEGSDEYDDSGNISSKACGMLPRLCLNKSLCLLNPVPGLKVRTHSSLSFGSEVGKSGKAASIESHSPKVNKHSRDAIYKHKSGYGVRPPKLLETENKMTCESNQYTHSSEQQITNRSSPYRRGISPYRNERPQSPFRGMGFLGVPKEAENLRAKRLNSYNKASSKSQELLSHRTIRSGSGSLSPAVEKTLYVDTVNFEKISSSNSSSSGSKGQMDSVDKDFDTSIGIKLIREAASIDSSLLDGKCLNSATRESISEPKISGFVETNQSSFYGISHPGDKADIVERFQQDRAFDEKCKSLECIKLITADGNLNSSTEQNLEVDDDPRYINSGCDHSSLPPPLPKTPSESWLWRTLPSVPSRNVGTRFQPRKQDSKTPLTNTKWETIVKTSYSHHDHARYSQELTSHFSNQSKT